MKYVATTGGREILVEIVDEHHIIVDGVSYEIDFESVSEQTVYSLLANNKSHDALVYESEEGWQVLLHGSQYVLVVEDEREKRLRETLGGGPPQDVDYHLRAPMPGLIVTVPVEEEPAAREPEVGVAPDDRGEQVLGEFHGAEVHIQIEPILFFTLPHVHARVEHLLTRREV